MDKRVFILAHEVARMNAIQAVKEAPSDSRVVVQGPSRSLDQNAAMWPILHEFSQQLEWPVNGRMRSMTPEEWKDVLTAAFEKEKLQLAMGIDGGVVMLGKRTREFSRKRFSEWIEFLLAVAAQRGVVLEKGYALQE